MVKSSDIVGTLPLAMLLTVLALALALALLLLRLSDFLMLTVFFLLGFLTGR